MEEHLYIDLDSYLQSFWPLYMVNQNSLRCVSSAMKDAGLSNMDLNKGNTLLKGTNEIIITSLSIFLCKNKLTKIK